MKSSRQSSECLFACVFSALRKYYHFNYWVSCCLLNPIIQPQLCVLVSIKLDISLCLDFSLLRMTALLLYTLLAWVTPALQPTQNPTETSEDKWTLFWGLGPSIDLTNNFFSSWNHGNLWNIIGKHSVTQ